MWFPLVPQDFIPDECLSVAEEYACFFPDMPAVDVRGCVGGLTPRRRKFLEAWNPLLPIYRCLHISLDVSNNSTKACRGDLPVIFGLRNMEARI